jgi:Uncharacterized conserved protein
MKVSIFLDFWNFTLSFKNDDPAFRPDWFAVPQVFKAEAASLLSDLALDLQDFNIFGSYSANGADAKLRNWISTFLPKIPGANVCFLQRQQKMSGPVCTQCHEEIQNCPKCGGSMLGTEEKCIDTLIATTMLQDAWMKKFDVAIIVSGDKDFIPAVDFLRTVGIRTIHAQFQNQGMELSKHCWGRFDIHKLKSKFIKC